LKRSAEPLGGFAYKFQNGIHAFHGMCGEFPLSRGTESNWRETTGHNACVAFDKETPAPLVVLVLMTPGVKGIAIIDSPSPVSPMGFHAS
jgi:hypothetical protein